MSLDVALQSVAFYVLSCGTCAKINHRRKARVQAKRERAEKQELERDQPGLYHHPSPFNTNPYWTEEIMMGPGPPKQKNGNKNASQRALNTAGQGSSYAGSTALSSDPPSSPTAGTESSRLSGDGWNRKRYQREDEALWGHDVPGPGQRIMDAIAKAGSSARTVLESRLNRGSPCKEDDEPSRSYFQARNPPVNDLHPPVVSTAPSSRDETRWMLQPPPSAKVMEGKERVNRSRAGSNGSSRRGVEDTPLSRQLTERLVGAKLQRGETPSFFEARSLSTRTETRARTPNSNWPKPQYQERGRSPSLEPPESSSLKRGGSRPPPISLSTSERSSWDAIEHIPIPSSAHLSPNTTEMSEQSTRPVLTTILSSSVAIPHAPSEDDLEALRELNTPLSTNDTNLRTQSPSKRLSPSANAMPASIPSAESKVSGVPNPRFPEVL